MNDDSSEDEDRVFSVAVRIRTRTTLEIRRNFLTVNVVKLE